MEEWKFDEKTNEPYFTGKYLESIKRSNKWVDLRDSIPAWSLHRLIEMALKDLLICGISFVFNDYSYDKVIEFIEFQIKCGRFPKEYLV
jgi:hypothetical protein